MNKEMLSEKIFLYKDVISDKLDIVNELEKIFTLYEKDYRAATINDNEYNLELRSCMVFSLFPDPGENNLVNYQKAKTSLNNKINSEISNNFLDYIKTFNLKIKEREPWEILRYEKTQKLDWHNDNGITHPCTISFVLYINDDYEGGEIQFRDQLGGIPYKPPKNSLIIFPASEEYIHRVLPVTKGTKSAAISFGK
jgi:hypothetical protein